MSNNTGAARNSFRSKLLCLNFTAAVAFLNTRRMMEYLLLLIILVTVAVADPCKEQLDRIEGKIDSLLSGLQEIHTCSCNTPQTSCLENSEALVAYYSFNDDDTLNDDSGNGRNGVASGNVQRYSGGPQGLPGAGGALHFQGSGKVDVDAFRNFQWGSKFSVSVWFRRTGGFGNYQGIIGNGYHTSGSWEVRMGRENNGQMLGGGVVTSDNPVTWNYVNLVAEKNTWHHVVMTYNGSDTSFYLDNQKQAGAHDCCHGDIIPKNTPLTIGKAGVGHGAEYFVGFIDEVRLYSCALSADEVDTLYGAFINS
ncbi:PREDICTED: uncharacterized protein LOC106816219 [Priapulus caudatus]|uniref:Uncharacterized protein LOC106816219 n=1 Tax=Priapulus caudatus TaxID=37621 RepID=A0ABM1EVR2_PRICU|nr:PREDICTED: uncharacterized protein LOC106816219 [Priapulus caudatus]